MRKVWIWAALLWLGAEARAQEDVKAEILITNSRRENVVMSFDYAFRQYTWNLIRHTMEPDDEITYRFPSNIPGCEYLRQWNITDGILTLSNDKGPLCVKCISLCDKRESSVDVNARSCTWRER